MPALRRKTEDRPRGRVTRIAGAVGREICELEAKAAEDAIKRVIREHGIDQQAYRVG